MRRSLSLLLLLGIAVPVLAAGKKEQERLEEAGVVMKEVLDIPEGIPKELVEKAECVVVLPSVKKGAIGIGISYGRGAMVCRTGANFTGGWGAPGMMGLEQGSIGWQLGGQATDFILLLMKPRPPKWGLTHKGKIGAGGSAGGRPQRRTPGK